MRGLVTELFLTLPPTSEPEEKEKLDQEFAKNRTDHLEKAKTLNERLSGWAYQVDQSVLENAELKRDSFFREKPKPEEKKNDSTAPATAPGGK